MLYKKGGDKMTKISKEERERRAKDVARAVFEARQLKKHIALTFNQKSKEYIVTYLIHVIQELKEIHDQYNPLGKELPFNDE